MFQVELFVFPLQTVSLQEEQSKAYKATESTCTPSALIMSEAHAKVVKILLYIFFLTYIIQETKSSPTEMKSIEGLLELTARLTY